VDEVGGVLIELKRQALSVLLVEQNLPLVLRVADTVHVLSKGQVVFSGSPAALQDAPDVMTRYLALEHPPAQTRGGTIQGKIRHD
jgi:ABC-type branched-subunit amino acid transport system ATPase component